MKTFNEYSRSCAIACNPEVLDYGMNEAEYRIYEGSNLLHTPGLNIFSHSSERAIRLLVTDLQLYTEGSLQWYSSPVLYSFRKDIMDAGNDPFLDQWAGQLVRDPFVQSKTSGQPASQAFGPDDPLFTFSFITLASLVEKVNAFAGKLMSENILEESDMHPFPELLRLSYGRLSNDQKMALQALSGVHHSGIVLPLLTVVGEIDSFEYAKALISLKIQPKDRYVETCAAVFGVMTYLGSIMQKPWTEKSTSAIVREGEGDAIEFKSTLRWDIRAGKTNSAIERACLKTVSAFLNSKGGTLLIGVRDDGSIEGIETDKFANDDKFLLHFWTLIRTCIGKNFGAYFRTRLEKIEGKTVCIVECLPSHLPVFLRQPGFDEEMFIRVGPSSNAMDISEALKYIEDHFPKFKN